MEIRGRAWRPGDLKSFYKAEYICPEAYNDQAAIVEAATDRVRAELIAHSGTEKDPELYYNIPSYEYSSLIKDVREKALKEAWDLARRIVTCGPDCYTGSDFVSVFGSCNAISIFELSADEALAKDKKHQEDKKALHVGDEVEFDLKMGFVSEKHRGYITNLISPVLVRVLTKKYGTITVSPGKCKKTGHHNEEIEKAMASFGEGEYERTV